MFEQQKKNDKGCKKRRGKPKYARYKALRKHEKSHIRRMKRHLQAHSRDEQARKALTRYEAILYTPRS